MESAQGESAQIQAAEIKSVLFIAPFGLGQKTTVWARILPLAQFLRTQGIAADILIPPWDTPAHSGLAWDDQGVRMDNVRTAHGPGGILARLLKRVWRRQPQIVHIVKPVAYAGAVQSILWYARATRAFTGKIVLDVDDWEQGWARLNRRSWPIRRLITAQENWGLGHADGITAASQWLVETARTANRARPVCYLPNGITALADDASRVARAADPATAPAAGNPTAAESPCVLYFTRFMEVAPDWFVTFCATLLSQHPTARIIVAGSGIFPDLEEDFKTEFARHTTQLDRTRIDWRGHIPIDRLTSLYESSACAVFPAQATPLQQAKCSVRLATTLLHGVPIVASAVGEQIAYGRTGAVELVDPAARPDTFAHAVLKVLADPSRLAQRQSDERARLLAEYAWPRLGDRLLQFYSAVLAR